MPTALTSIEIEMPQKQIITCGPNLNKTNKNISVTAVDTIGFS